MPWSILRKHDCEVIACTARGSSRCLLDWNCGSVCAISANAQSMDRCSGSLSIVHRWTRRRRFRIPARQVDVGDTAAGRPPTSQPGSPEINSGSQADRVRYARNGATMFRSTVAATARSLGGIAEHGIKPRQPSSSDRISWNVSISSVANLPNGVRGHEYYSGEELAEVLRDRTGGRRTRHNLHRRDRSVRFDVVPTLAELAMAACVDRNPGGFIAVMAAMYRPRNSARPRSSFGSIAAAVSFERDYVFLAIVQSAFALMVVEWLATHKRCCYSSFSTRSMRGRPCVTRAASRLVSIGGEPFN